MALKKTGIENGAQVAKACPKCASKLVVRTNRQNGTQFLGCPNWPECTHTEPIPEELAMRLRGHPTLFEF